jgi:hypothetical protein
LAEVALHRLALLLVGAKINPELPGVRVLEFAST